MSGRNRFYRVEYMEGKHLYAVGIVAPDLRSLVFILTKDALIPEKAIRKIAVEALHTSLRPMILR